MAKVDTEITQNFAGSHVCHRHPYALGSLNPVGLDTQTAITQADELMKRCQKLSKTVGEDLPSCKPEECEVAKLKMELEKLALEKLRSQPQSQAKIS